MVVRDYFIGLAIDQIHLILAVIVATCAASKEEDCGTTNTLREAAPCEHLRYHLHKAY